MAVFTAIASAIVGAIGISTATIIGSLTWAGLATSIVAGGLAMATAKASGVFSPPQGQAAKDPGVKVQLAPSTDNRIPVFYGRNVTGAIAIDAEIKNQNNTMVYVMVIGEKTDSGSYSINNIYRGDAKLNFGSGASSHVVQSITDPNATSSNQVSGKMRCRVFAGNAQSSVNQVFPTTGTPVTAQSLVTTITADTNYEDLVYAVFELDYDPENGLTQLGNMTFDITNSLNSPANVLLDYCTNTRYGAGLASGDLVLTSFDEMWDNSNINGTTGNVEYVTTAGVSAYHDRYQIDGMLSTYQPVKSNIDQICQSSATFFTYDAKQGKFKVVPNREATTAEKSAAFLFDNDNILTAINISSTELYSLYNSIEAEYPEVNRKDQTNIVIVDTPSGDRNVNEPDNPLNTRYNLVNDLPRVHNLANIDLRQSRDSMVVDFDADYSAIQVDVGDVVKLTSDKYSFSEKLFRCMQVTEKEGADGMLSVNVILLEYADSVYTHSVQQTQNVQAATGIPGWWTDWGNANIDIGNVTIVDDPTGDTANIVDSSNGTVIGNVDIANINIPNGPYGPIAGPWMGIEPQIPNGVFFDQLEINVEPQNVSGTGNVANTVLIYDPPGNTPYFSPDYVENIAIPISGYGNNSTNMPNVESVIITVQGRDTITGVKSQISSSTAIDISPKNFVPKEHVATFTAGAQIEDAPTSNSSMTSGSTLIDVTTPAIYDLTGVDLGDYSFSAVANAGGTIPGGGYDVGFDANVRVQYSNVTATTNVTQNMGGVSYFGIDQAPPQLVATNKVPVDPTAHSLPADMLPVEAEIVLKGFSTLTSPTMGQFKYEMLRVTKSEK